MYDIFMNELQCKKRKEIHDGGELQENKKLFKDSYGASSRQQICLTCCWLHHRLRNCFSRGLLFLMMLSMWECVGSAMAQSCS